MTLFIVAAVIVIALIAFFAVRASRTPVRVASAAELEARELDEGMIVGDVVPLGSPDDPAVVPIFPIEPDVFAESTGAVEPIPARAPEARDAPTADAPRRYDIRWAKRFESPEHPFDDATRLGLLLDLGIVRAPWGVPLLAQAYEEEPGVDHRRAALRSLAAYRHPDTQGIFEVALHSEDDEERAIAEYALTALQIRAALPS